MGFRGPGSGGGGGGWGEKGKLCKDAGVKEKEDRERGSGTGRDGRERERETPRQTPNKIVSNAKYIELYYIIIYSLGVYNSTEQIKNISLHP